MRALPLSDARAFRDATVRTALERLLLALAVLAAAVAATVAAREPVVRTTALLPEGSNGIVVLDLSASISGDTHRRIRATLLRLAAEGGRYGLVAFSDAAYEVLPPGTPAAHLRRVARYYSTRQGQTSDPNPWTIVFSQGTRISEGLGLARSIVERDRLDPSAVLLVSDLDDDPNDLPLLRRTLEELQSLGTVVRVVGLDPSPEDERLFRRLLAEPDAIGRATLEAPTGSTSAVAAVPWELLLLTAVLAAALAGYELWRARLRWAA